MGKKHLPGKRWGESGKQDRDGKNDATHDQVVSNLLVGAGWIIHRNLLIRICEHSFVSHSY